MRRPPVPGTPWRSSRYWMRPASALVRWSLAVAAAVLFAVLGTFFLVSHRVASPGALSSAHRDVTEQRDCVQCHQPAHAADDMRCQRCHDPLDANRLAVTAHAAVGAGVDVRSVHTGSMKCAACHTEHAGASSDLKRVDDRRCDGCHQFGSFRHHPAFASERAARDSSSSLEFSHLIHLREVAKTRADRCQSCHQATRDGRGFEPIAFDTHCASCHVVNGSLTSNGTAVLKSGWIPGAALPSAGAPWRAPAQIDADDRGRVMFEGFSHRDPWVTAVASQLTRRIAGSSLALERASQERRRDNVSALLSTVPLASMMGEDLAAWQTILDGEISALERAGDGQPNGQRINGRQAADPQLVAQERANLDQLLTAIAGRAAGPAAERVAALKDRLARSAPGGASAAPPDAGAVRERLDAIDMAVSRAQPAIRGAAAEDIRSLTAEIRRLTRGDTVDQPSHDQQRMQTLALLNAVEPKATPLLRARLGELRSLFMLTAREGATVRDAKVSLRGRIALERSLRQDGGPVPVDAIVNAERGEATRALGSLPVLDPPATNDAFPSMSTLDPARARTALGGALGGCVWCHRLDADKAALRPVVAARPGLSSAVFTHKPHLLREQCESCHRTIGTSNTGEDINLPGVAKCQECHQSARPRADCVSCHRYHPRSAAELAMAQR